jgi:nucleoside phosphorylase
MHKEHNPKRRLGISLHEAAESSSRLQPGIANAPPLPSIDFSLIGKPAPVSLPTPADHLPQASAVVITWANAEWAALHHVFCANSSPMPYNARSSGSFTGWEKYSAQLPHNKPSGWTYWGYYRLIQVAGKNVLLFKSNTHLDWPGATELETLINLLTSNVNPDLILSIGTAGGAKPQDHIGTVRAVSAGTLYESGKPSADWPEYKNGWEAPQTVLNNSNFNRLLFPVPTQTSDLQALCSKFNQHYNTSYTLAELNPDELNLADSTPQIDNQTGGTDSLLTTSSFVVGTTAGNYQEYAAIEMDDAIIAKACAGTSTQFGFVRNVSDPVQNAVLPSKIQGNWGSAIYDAYGFYTSYNGAVTAWAMLS